MRFAVESDPDLSLTGAYDLLRHPNVPEKTRNSEDPFRIQLTDKVHMRFG